MRGDGGGGTRDTGLVEKWAGKKKQKKRKKQTNKNKNFKKAAPQTKTKPVCLLCVLWGFCGFFFCGGWGLAGEKTQKKTAGKQGRLFLGGGGAGKKKDTMGRNKPSPPLFWERGPFVRPKLPRNKIRAEYTGGRHGNFGGRGGPLLGRPFWVPVLFWSARKTRGGGGGRGRLGGLIPVRGGGENNTGGAPKIGDPFVALLGGILGLENFQKIFAWPMKTHVLWKPNGRGGAHVASGTGGRFLARQRKVLARVTSWKKSGA